MRLLNTLLNYVPLLPLSHVNCAQTSLRNTAESIALPCFSQEGKWKVWERSALKGCPAARGGRCLHHQQLLAAKPQEKSIQP